MRLEHYIAGTMIIALTFYVLMAGADYGGGVWDLCAWGPRAGRQRKLIADVIGPMWEANHVWLILVIVILFTAFPDAFALICISLYVPLTLMLVGITLRGASFTFRHYDTEKDSVQRRWGSIFAISSLLTPITLGITVGALSAGHMRKESTSDFVLAWLAPFPVAVGFLALALFAFLAATYLTCESPDPDLTNDFRQRALGSQAAVAIMALSVFLLAREGAPAIFQHLTTSPWAWSLQSTTAIVSLAAIASLIKGKYKWARMFAAGQATLILWGWAHAQFPYLVRPELTIQGSAAAPATLRLLLIALIAGAGILFPSLYCLLKIFRTPSTEAD